MLDNLGQIYIISSFVGSAFILVNFAMGQLGAVAHMGGGHHLGLGGHNVGGAGHAGFAGHSLGTGHDSGAGGHDFGASGDGSGGGGHDFGASGDGDGGGGGHDFGASGDGDGGPNTSAHANAVAAALGSYRLAGGHGKIGHKMTNTLTVPSGQSLETSDRIGFFILGLLSPMNIAIQLAFFGFGGLLVLHAYPLLGLLTLIPAVLISLGASNLFRVIVSWMVRSMESPAPLSMNDIVGMVGEVNTPIPAGHIGEITYVADAKRCHAPAKAQSATLSLKRGDKVIVTDTNEGLFIVTPWSDSQLDEDFTPQG